MSPPSVRVNSQSGSLSEPPLHAVDASPGTANQGRTGNYDFPFQGTPIIQQELIGMGSDIPRGSRHGNAEQFEQIDADWTNRIPAAVSGDTTPRLSPRVSTQQPRSALTLPAADQSEEETEASLGAGTQLLRVQVRMREMNSIILSLQKQMIIARDFTDSLTLRLKKAELVIEEKFQTTVGLSLIHI